ncbi:MAG: dihydrofolate reductase [Chromatiaceae bacterium]|nr:MAG: dihydrofolate reductase [Chromatiaceae bacterium]
MTGTPTDPAPATPPACVIIVAALAHNRVIGRDNRLPWHLPADLAHFRQLTLDKPIIMGRRTWESLPGLLPRRRHIVVSGDPAFTPIGAEVASSPAAALELAGAVPEVMVVGGAMLYRALLPQARRMELTLVDAEIAGDTRFPDWDASAWVEVARVHRPADARNVYALDFLTLQRH